MDSHCCLRDADERRHPSLRCHVCRQDRAPFDQSARTGKFTPVEYGGLRVVYVLVLCLRLMVGGILLLYQMIDGWCLPSYAGLRMCWGIPPNRLAHTALTTDPATLPTP
jgi:hypothetical protein